MNWNWMLKNSAGVRDGSFSLAVYSWIVVSLCLFLSSIESFGNFLTFKIPDSTLLLGYLAAMTGNYMIRRNKKDELEAGSEQVEDEK